MNVRRGIVLAAAAALAGRAAAEGNQQPPSDSSEKSSSQKAQELGKQGEDAAKKGASSAKDALNEAGQAATAKVVGTKTVDGRVDDVSKEQVMLKDADGKALQLRVTDSTQVIVGGQQGAVASLKKGDDVRATFAQSGGAATATKIEVKRSSSGSTSK